MIIEKIIYIINYFSIGKVSDTYDMSSKIYNIKDIFEYSHYNESHLYQLPNFIEIPLLYSDNKLYLNREDINDKIKENLDSISYEAWMNNLYDTDIYYILDDEDKKYKYNIKLTLK